jgi:Leucine-rich repeat (LRR) protein
MQTAKILGLVLGLILLAGCGRPSTPLGAAGQEDTLSVVAFADARLESAVREALGRPQGVIPMAALEPLTQLGAPGRGIRDLGGIEHLGHLEVLDLADNAIQDLQPLAALGRLTHLGLENNQITDLRPLASLGYLQVLLLAGNQVQDLEPLLDLRSLQHVELAGNDLDGEQGRLDRLRQRGVVVDLGERTSGANTAGSAALLPTCEQPALAVKRNLLLGTAEDVRALLNPPERRCLDLQGYLILGGSGSASLASLEGLQTLYRVESDLSILLSAYLADLRGLENLHEVGRSLSITSNPHLQSLAGLARLTRVGGHLSTSHNSQLLSLEGLENLQRVEGNLYIVGNPLLVSLRDFPQLTYIGGSLQIAGNIALSSLGGLESLETVGKRIEIFGNPELAAEEIKWLVERLVANGFAGEVYTADNQP